MQGNRPGDYLLPAGACEATLNRKAVIVYLKSRWNEFEAECGFTTSYGVSKSDALMEVST